MMVAAAVRAHDGVLVVRRMSGVNAAGQISESFQEEIEDAARELGRQAVGFFADELRAQVPIILDENRTTIRDTVADSIKLALGESHLEDRLAEAESKFITGLVIATLVGIVGGAFFERLIT